MKNLKFLISVFIIAGMSSCDWFAGIVYRPGPCDASGPVIVYKTKNDYSNNLTVQLSKNGKEITAYPGKQDASHQRPITLENGYLLKRMVGDVVLSLTIDEYVNSSTNYTSADFFNLIIDRDPYLEKYQCCECTGRDTTAINELIRTNKLSNCDDLL